jgi:predicted outer membrane repeat protein
MTFSHPKVAKCFQNKKRNHKTQGAQTVYQLLEPRNLLATITVDTLSNVVADDGVISLREAITATNSNAAFHDAPAGDATGDVIKFSPSLSGSTIETSQLPITDDLVIRGFDVTLDGNQGRVFSVQTSETVTLSRLKFVGGSSDKGGAIRFGGGGRLRIYASEFENNHATARGGAIWGAGGTLILNQTEFRNNRSDIHGGAVYLNDQAATAIILQSTFEQNESYSRGGAIYTGASDKAFVFRNTQFTNNTSGEEFFASTGGSGGAIFANGLLRVGFSSFTGNSTTHFTGGAVGSFGARLTIANSSFVGNISSRGGGAIAARGSIVLLNSVTFVDNRTTGDTTISHQFGEGGALLISKPSQSPGVSNLTIRNSVFQNNRASDSGGAIHSTVTQTISDSFFGGNQAFGADPVIPHGGGAVYQAQGILKIHGTTFQNNQMFNGEGAGVLALGSSLEIGTSTFSGNRSDQNGGGLYTSSANVSIFKTDFIQNRAGTSSAFLGSGGGVFARPANLQNISITGGLFQDNVASVHGGGLAILEAFNGTNAEVTIRQGNGENGTTRIVGNRALQSDGGGIYASANMRIRDALFSENTARNGGAVFADKGSVSLIGGEVTDNEARLKGGGLFVSRIANVTIDTFFETNSALEGDDVFEEV